MSGITPLPDPPSRSDPENFAARGDAFVDALLLFQAEANALAALMGVAVNIGYLQVTADGEVTMSDQPAFLAVDVSNADVTGDGTAVTTLGNTEIYDLGGNFASCVFTAPVAGRYEFSATVTLADLAAGHTTGELTLVTSNRNYPLDSKNVGAIRTAGNQCILAGSFSRVDMDAGDTASLSLTVSGGAKVVDVANVRFSGGLQH